MATETPSARAADIPVSDQSPVALSPKVVEAYESMIATIPESGGEGMDNILEQLAAATDAADLDAPWRSFGLDELLNTPLEVRAVRKIASDYPGGLPWFLVVDAAVLTTGELVTFTTGAVSVMAQLIKAYNLGAFPWRVIPRQSDRPSKSGYYPQHLEVVTAGHAG